MEQNKNIENQFRQKLNERTIEPTDKAWDRLDAMLSVSEKKKSKRTWLWAVASLAVLMTIGSFFFRTDNSEVITNDELITNYELRITTDEIITDPTPTPEIVPDNQIIPQDSFRVVQNIGILNNNDYFDDENTEIEIIDIEIKTEIETNTYVTAQDLLDDIEESKPKEVLAERNSPSKISIDHKSLLYQAEQEVEENYRKNAIDRLLHKGFNNAKVALSNRNQK